MGLVTVAVDHYLAETKEALIQKMAPEKKLNHWKLFGTEHKQVERSGEE